MENYKYDIFISYKHEALDKAVAAKLQKSLEHYKIPKEIQKKTGKENCYKRCGESISGRWHFTQDAKEFRSGGGRASGILVAVRDAVSRTSDTDKYRKDSLNR